MANRDPWQDHPSYDRAYETIRRILAHFVETEGFEYEKMQRAHPLQVRKRFDKPRRWVEISFGTKACGTYMDINLSVVLYSLAVGHLMYLDKNGSWKGLPSIAANPLDLSFSPNTRKIRSGYDVTIKSNSDVDMVTQILIEAIYSAVDQVEALNSAPNSAALALSNPRTTRPYFLANNEGRLRAAVAYAVLAGWDVVRIGEIFDRYERDYFKVPGAGFFHNFLRPRLDQIARARLAHYRELIEAEVAKRASQA